MNTANPTAPPEPPAPSATPGNTPTRNLATSTSEPATTTPATGEFLTRDPLETLTQAPYRYADNNPTNATDPTGEIAIVVAAGAVMLVGDLATYWAATPAGQQACQNLAMSLQSEWNGLVESASAIDISLFKEPLAAKRYSDEELETASETLTDAEKAAVRAKQTGQPYEKDDFVRAVEKLKKSEKYADERNKGKQRGQGPRR